MSIDKPAVRVSYELKVLGLITLEGILEEFLKGSGK